MSKGSNTDADRPMKDPESTTGSTKDAGDNAEKFGHPSPAVDKAPPSTMVDGKAVPPGKPIDLTKD
jgi:hypothetical protein